MRRARDAEERKFVRYTADELSKLESETDWAKVDATTKDEVERQAEAHHGPLPERWEDAVLPGVPGLGAVSISASTLTCWNGSRRMAAAIRPASTPRFERLFELGRRGNIRGRHRDDSTGE